RPPRSTLLPYTTLFRSGPVYLPALEKPFTKINDWLADNMRGNPIGFGATLLKVFIPYLVWNTVFDNARITSETGKKPAPFSAYKIGRHTSELQSLTNIV